MKLISSSFVKYSVALLVLGMLGGCTVDVGNLVGAGLQLACAFLESVVECPS